MVVSANTNICPRCRGRINTFREYAECIACGYVDYERECEYPRSQGQKHLELTYGCYPIKARVKIFRI